MDYLSPFHLIYDDPATADLSVVPSFQKIKRKLLAKYELVDNEAIQIKGNWINRGDALKLIEDLKDEKQMAFHQTIFSKPDLLSFLEEGNEVLLKNPDTSLSDEFRNNLSPFFSRKFGVLFFKAFKEAESILAYAKFPLEIYVNEEDENFAFSKIYSAVKNKSIELEPLHFEVPNKQLVKNGKQIREFLPIAFIKRINTLPQYFEDVREMIADEVHSMACRINDDAGKYGLALDVLKYGSKIKVGPEMKEEYNRVYRVLKGNDAGVDDSDSGSWGGVGLYIVKAVVILLIVIFRTNGCEDRDASYKHIDYKSNFPHGKFKQKIDSILKAQKKDKPTSVNYEDWKHGR